MVLEFDICLWFVLNCFQVRRLEAKGVPSVQAEAITAAITEVLNDSLENVAQSFVSKGEMQKVGILSKFISLLSGYQPSL